MANLKIAISQADLDRAFAGIERQAVNLAHAYLNCLLLRAT